MHHQKKQKKKRRRVMTGRTLSQILASEEKAVTPFILTADGTLKKTRPIEATCSDETQPKEPKAKETEMTFTRKPQLIIHDVSAPLRHLKVLLEINLSRSTDID